VLPGAKRVRIWFWLPADDNDQKVLDLTVTNAPAGYRLTRDAAYGNSYLYAEVRNPTLDTILLATDFLLRRTEVGLPVDPGRVGPLTYVHRTQFAEFLRPDCTHMEVTDEVKALATQVCGSESNIVLQSRILADWVVEHTDHYSKPNAPKSSGQGDAAYCLANGGGGCSDQHALFIALARARGIPTRLQFGSLLKLQNKEKDVDPGYRCWVQYFAPGYGWVPLDLSAADTAATPDGRAQYLAGRLDDHRVRFAEGRDLDLSPRQDGLPVNLFIGAYVEVDGKPHTAVHRTLWFNEIR